MNTPEGFDEGVLVRRMGRARFRQWVIAVISLSTAALIIAGLSPESIGSFAYYSVLALLLLNAIIALRQCIHVFFPIETLLRKLRTVEQEVANGQTEISHFSIHSDDAFACLTAGLDSLISRLLEEARAARERSRQADAMIAATPFTIYTVSRAGKVYSIIKDEFNLVAPLALQEGQIPTPEAWGKENASKYLQAINLSFKEPGFRWFDLDIGSYHLRGCVRQIDQLTALIELGNMPAIDRIVSNMAGSGNAHDFTGRQDALKHFAASIAHDARNVFTALGNLVEISKQSTDASVRELMPLAEDGIRHGKQMMTELVQYAGEARYNLMTRSAAEVGHELCEGLTLRALIPPNITLKAEVSDRPMPDIEVDIEQFWKVVFNLVKNATEAIGRTPGRITLKAEPYEMSSSELHSFRASHALAQGAGVLLTVSDDGPGIPAALLNQIFAPYISSKGPGRGLGLATTLTVVDAHNGAIRVTSSRGAGTTFEIFLPASRQTQEELDEIRKVAPNGEVVLVDDSPLILKTTALILKTIQIAAHPAANEEDALRKVRTLNRRLRAVLVDAHLGPTSSASLVRHIRDEWPNLKIILISGDSEDAVRELFAGVSYDAFLSKPFELADLAHLLGVTSPPNRPID